MSKYLEKFDYWKKDEPDSKVKNDKIEGVIHMPMFAEATPFYIASRDACKRMSVTIPDVKLIVMLREPVARAYSEYQMKKR